MKTTKTEAYEAPICTLFDGCSSENVLCASPDGGNEGFIEDTFIF